MAWLTRWSRARLRRDIELSEVYVLQLEREMEKHRHRAQALRVRLARMEP